VAAATGAVVVGSAGVAAVVITQHKPKKPPTAPIRVELASYNRTVTGLDLRGARYARVTGRTRRRAPAKDQRGAGRPPGLGGRRDEHDDRAGPATVREAERARRTAPDRG
jgi:hypothetical protein